MGKKYPKDPHEKKPFYFDRKILSSKAFWALTETATKYLTLFLSWRQVHRVKTTGLYIDRNDGQLVFPCKRAATYGVSKGRHSRGLKKLHEVGFIDINHLGGGMDGDYSTFHISKRWEKYGTPDFVQKEWPKDTRKKGNPKIRNYGKGRA